MAAAGGMVAISNLAFYLRLRRTRKRLDLPAAWSGKLPVYEVEGLSSPCLFGLFRPAVYLNRAAMDAEHPEHILAHEYAHYRHGDLRQAANWAPSRDRGRSPGWISGYPPPRP